MLILVQNYLNECTVSSLCTYIKHFSVAFKLYALVFASIKHIKSTTFIVRAHLIRTPREYGYFYMSLWYPRVPSCILCTYSKTVMSVLFGNISNRLIMLVLQAPVHCIWLNSLSKEVNLLVHASSIILVFLDTYES